MLYWIDLSKSKIGNRTSMLSFEATFIDIDKLFWKSQRLKTFSLQGVIYLSEQENELRSMLWVKVNPI